MLFPATSPCASVAAPPHVGEVGVRQAIRASATGALRPLTTTRAASRPATGTSPSSVRPSANPRSRGRSVRSRLAPKLPGLQRTLQLRQLRRVSLHVGCNARCNSPLHLARKDRFTHAASPSRPVRNRPRLPLGPRRHSRWRLPELEEASPHTIALLGPPLPALRLRRFTPFAAPQAEQRGYRLASLSP